MQFSENRPGRGVLRAAGQAGQQLRRVLHLGQGHAERRAAVQAAEVDVRFLDLDANKPQKIGGDKLYSYLKKFGIDTTFVEATDPDAFVAAMRPWPWP